jgi:hypothetical protein
MSQIGLRTNGYTLVYQGTVSSPQGGRDCRFAVVDNRTRHFKVRLEAMSYGMNGVFFLFSPLFRLQEYTFVV